MFRGDEPGIYIKAARPDGHVVIAGDKVDTAQLLDLQTPPRGPEGKRMPLQRDDAMAEAVQMRIALSILASQIVHQNDCGVPSGEELLEQQDLTPVTQRILGEQSHFRKTVEDDAGRVGLFYLGLNQLDGVSEFQLPRVEDGLLTAFAEYFVR